MPTSLVVKNGSKILSMISGGMPVPVSSTSTSTYSPIGMPLYWNFALCVGADIGGAQRELAAVGHRVARIDHEIDDHLLELREIGLHRPEVALRHDVERDPLADQPAQQHGQVVDHVAEVDDLRAQRLLAREREQVAHHARRRGWRSA